MEGRGFTLRISLTAVTDSITSRPFRNGFRISTIPCVMKNIPHDTSRGIQGPRHPGARNVRLPTIPPPAILRSGITP